MLKLKNILNYLKYNFFIFLLVVCLCILSCIIYKMHLQQEILLEYLQKIEIVTNDLERDSSEIIKIIMNAKISNLPNLQNFNPDNKILQKAVLLQEIMHTPIEFSIVPDQTTRFSHVFLVAMRTVSVAFFVNSMADSIWHLNPLSPLPLSILKFVFTNEEILPFIHDSCTTWLSHKLGDSDIIEIMELITGLVYIAGILRLWFQ